MTGSSPTSSSAVRAWALDRPAPLNGAGGGDLPVAVEGPPPTSVVVVALRVLVHQLEAVGAASHRGGRVAVDHGDRIVVSQRVAVSLWSASFS